MAATGNDLPLEVLALIYERAHPIAALTCSAASRHLREAYAYWGARASPRPRGLCSCMCKCRYRPTCRHTRHAEAWGHAGCVRGKGELDDLARFGHDELLKAALARLARHRPMPLAVAAEAGQRRAFCLMARHACDAPHCWAPGIAGPVVERGDVEFAEDLRAHAPPGCWTQDLVRVAAANGHVRMTEWLLGFMPGCGGEALRAAASGRHPELVRRLVAEHKLAPDEQACLLAIRGEESGGRPPFPTLEALAAEGGEWTGAVRAEVWSTGCLDSVRLVCGDRIPDDAPLVPGLVAALQEEGIEIHSGHLENAIRRGGQSLVEAIIASYGTMGVDVCRQALIAGQDDIAVRWMPDPPPPVLLAFASAGGCCRAVRALREAGVPWGGDEMTHAVRAGRTQTLWVLWSLGCPPGDVLARAVEAGDLAAVQLLRAQGVPWAKTEAAIAIRAGLGGVLREMYAALGYPKRPEEMAVALEAGDPWIVEQLHRCGVPWCGEEARHAAESRSPELLEVLRRNCAWLDNPGPIVEGGAAWHVDEHGDLACDPAGFDIRDYYPRG